MSVSVTYLVYVIVTAPHMYMLVTFHFVCSYCHMYTLLQNVYPQRRVLVILKLSSYGISGRVFTIFKSLPGRFMKVVMNGQSFLSPNLILLHINDLPKKIHRLLVNIYTGDITVCGCTSKNLDGYSLAADLSCD